MRAVRVDEFDYELPSELIAQRPGRVRSESRLLYLNGRTGEFKDGRFSALPEFLRPGDVVVFNDTRVINARLFGVKDTGGRVEVLVERMQGPRTAVAMVRASHPPRAGQQIRFGAAISARVKARDDDLFVLEFNQEVAPVLEQHGELPLPPYIERHAEPVDRERYQTVYARVPGAVAAPTAGLHFDDTMLVALTAAGIASAYVTLHVGAGTFQPVRTDTVEAHRMHSERYSVPQVTVDAITAARAAGGRVVAVGTTSLRALESAALEGDLRPGESETRLFVRPGYRFRVVDLLLTNFHLPRSTLLMLVSAFGGTENIRRAYRHAINQRYRFFSYGDAMLIERAAGEE